ALRVGEGRRDGLLAQHVDPVLEQKTRDLRVTAVRRCYERGVDSAGEISIIVDGSRARVSPGDAGGACGVGIDHGGEFRLWATTNCGQVVDFGYRPASD